VLNQALSRAGVEVAEKRKNTEQQSDPNNAATLVALWFQPSDVYLVITDVVMPD